MLQMSQPKKITKGTRVGVKGTDTRLGRVESAHEKLKNTWNVRMDGARDTTVFSSSLLLIVGDTVGLSPGSRLARAVTTGGVGGGGRAEEIDFNDEEEAEEGTPNDNADGDDGSGSSDEDEAEAFEVDDQKHAAKQQATFEKLESEAGKKIVVSLLSPLYLKKCHHHTITPVLYFLTRAHCCMHLGCFGGELGGVDGGAPLGSGPGRLLQKGRRAPGRRRPPRLPDARAPARRPLE
jgi:hypothetical protein